MDDVVLKPCPFCGGEARVRTYSSYDYDKEYYPDYTLPTDNFVECKKCGAQSGHIYDFWLQVWIDVIDLWNKRAK